ncbi:unnamed protein product, partial [Phaeothamnion confervicola]
MRESGGTEFSILRALFLKWDADQSGRTCSRELRGALRGGLGLRVSAQQADEIVAFYERKPGAGDFHYMELVAEVSNAMGNIVHHPSTAEVGSPPSA